MARLGRFLAACTLFVLALLPGTSPVQAADIKVLAPNAVKESILDIIANYEKATGHRVIMSWGGTESITKRINDGDIVDVVVNAAQNIDTLSKSGRLVQGSRTDFARSAVGAAVRSGLPKPDISSPDALKRALLQAGAIAISSGTSGRYLEGLFLRLGVAEQIKGKVKQPASGAQIGDMLARGEADLGFQQVSELLHVKGIDFVGPLPAEMQFITVYSAALHSAAATPDAARVLLKMLASPEAAPIIKKAGMDPP